MTSRWPLRLLTGRGSPQGSEMGRSATSPLFGRQVVTTREVPGELESRLEALGAEVMHVPLITTIEAPETVAGIEASWVIATSPNGARRAGPFVASTQVRLAAVGRATAEALADVAGRPVDVVPERSTARDLAAVLPAPVDDEHQLVVLRGDLADDTIADAARQLGWEVVDVVVYQTKLLAPGADITRRAAQADAVLLASGSAARAWAAAIDGAGVTSPPAVVIGPPTEHEANSLGLTVLAVADPPGIDGLIAATVCALGR